jgi:hypothetical protein
MTKNEELMAQSLSYLLICIQETAMMLERDRKLVEAQVKDMHARLDEAEHNALKVRQLINQSLGESNNLGGGLRARIFC